MAPRDTSRKRTARRAVRNVTPRLRIGQVQCVCLWSKVYKGLEVSKGQRYVWLGWTTREFKRLGW